VSQQSKTFRRSTIPISSSKTWNPVTNFESSSTPSANGPPIYIMSGLNYYKQNSKQATSTSSIRNIRLPWKKTVFVRVKRKRSFVPPRFRGNLYAAWTNKAKRKLKWQRKDWIKHLSKQKAIWWWWVGFTKWWRWVQKIKKISQATSLRSGISMRKNISMKFCSIWHRKLSVKLEE
jgi:hypothetical protein